MTIENLKQNLNKQVRYKPTLGESMIFRLKGCMIKLNSKTCQYEYEAHLQDIKSPWSVCIVPLELIESM